MVILSLLRRAFFQTLACPSLLGSPPLSLNPPGPCLLAITTISCSLDICSIIFLPLLRLMILSFGLGRTSEQYGQKVFGTPLDIEVRMWLGRTCYGLSTMFLASPLFYGWLSVVDCLQMTCSSPLLATNLHLVISATALRSVSLTYSSTALIHLLLYQLFWLWVIGG